MSHLPSQPWTKKNTQHEWYTVPDDDKRSYNLTKRYRQVIFDRSWVQGSKYLPSASFFGTPLLVAGGFTMLEVGMLSKKWWKCFTVFPRVFLPMWIIHRLSRDFYQESLIHKNLTWGRHEVGHIKRRMQGGKEHAVVVGDTRSHSTPDLSTPLVGGIGSYLFKEDRMGHIKLV